MRAFHFNHRHLEQENNLSAQNKRLAAQVTECQADLHDINDYLLNELKASFGTMGLCSCCHGSLHILSHL